MEVVSKDIAQSEVESWLDYKKISTQKRDAQVQSIESLVDAIADGYLFLNEDKVFVQTLKFPTEGAIAIKTLEFQSRLSMETLHNHLAGVKTGDVDARVLAHVAALTGKGKAVIKKLDTEDYAIASSIAIFFCRRRKFKQHIKINSKRISLAT